MRDFSEFSALWRAPLCSRAFYVDVALRWRGIAALYLLLILALTWLIVLIQVTLGVTNFVNNEAPAALKDFPPITIAKGIASSPVEQPYIMKDDKGHPIFVLDTTGETTEPAQAGARILLTRTHLIQEQRPGAVESRPLSAFPDMTIDSPKLLSWIRLFRNCVIPVGWPLALVFSFGYRMVAGLLLAAIGLGFNAAMGGRLGFQSLLRLGIVSMTLPILLDTVFWLFHVDIGCFTWLLFPALSLAYMAFAVWCSAEATRSASAFPVEVSAGPTPMPPSPLQ